MNRPRIIYSPESALRDPRRLLTEMRNDVRAALRIGFRLAKRDLDAQYRQTLFGYLWAVVPVLVTAGLWIVLNRATVLKVNTGDTPYWVFVLTGSVVWQSFVDALNGPLVQFQGNRVLLARVNFPKEALLISAGVQVLVSLALRMVVVIGVCLAVGAAVKPEAGLMVLPLVGLIVLGMVIGTLLVPAGALFGDVNRLVFVLTTPLMLVSPVAYPPEAVQGALRTAMHWNPLTPLIGLARDLMLAGTSAYWGSAVNVFSAGAALLLLGWTLYRLALPIIIEKLEA
jgi:homopolymeric O-antigen transport system permease protein